MTRRVFCAAAAAVLIGGGLGAYQLAIAGERPDCPGKIICPLTGEEICKDQCPLIDPNRPDCPGKIVCPQTGDLVYRDRCPVGGDSTKSGEKLRCCQGK